MNNFIYENTTKVYFGQGCVHEFLASLLNGYDHILLAYGQGSVKQNGIYDEVLNILMTAGKQVTEFPGIMPNPTYEKVQEGVSLVRENRTDLILAVGGGSVLDCAKAVSLAARFDGNAWENFWARKGIADFEPVPMGAVPTCSGTGSEFNGAAVITNRIEKIKTGYDYTKCSPKFALMDPAYTFSVPKIQMTSGSFDSLSHIMEIYFSRPDEQNVSDDLAEAVMRNIIRNMRIAAEDPADYQARSNLMWDAAMSENRLLKMGKQCDFACHLMEHQLSAYTDVSHSRGMAVLLPVYYRHIYRNGLHKFARFARNVWEISSEGKSEEKLAAEGIDALEQFIREMHLPATLRELGIREKNILKKIAGSCRYSPGSYRRLGADEIYDIFAECF